MCAPVISTESTNAKIFFLELLTSANRLEVQKVLYTAHLISHGFNFEKLAVLELYSILCTREKLFTFLPFLPIVFNKDNEIVSTHMSMVKLSPGFAIRGNIVNILCISTFLV